MKKYYILAFTFLCFFLGQNSYGQSNGNGDYVDTGDICDENSSAYDMCACNHYDWCALDEICIGSGCPGADTHDPCDIDSSSWNPCVCDPNWCDSGDVCDPNSSAYDYNICYGTDDDDDEDYCYYYPEICYPDDPNPNPDTCTTTCPTGYELVSCECVKIPCTTTCESGYVLNDDTCECRKLPPCPENAKDGIAPNGKVIGIFFQGGPDGGGNIISAIDGGGAGKHFTELLIASTIEGKDFTGEVIAPGVTATSGVAQGKAIIENAYNPGDQVVIYGYSYGGDLAVDLATTLKDLNIPVNLLITVDGSDGPLQNTTVNTSIPDNVLVNLNVYQTNDSGASSGSQIILNNAPNSGTSNSPGSNGGSNTAIDSSKTKVYNENVTGTNITHGNIQDADLPKTIIDNQINNHIRGCN